MFRAFLCSVILTNATSQQVSPKPDIEIRIAKRWEIHALRLCTTSRASALWYTCSGIWQGTHPLSAMQIAQGGRQVRRARRGGLDGAQRAGK